MRRFDVGSLTRDAHLAPHLCTNRAPPSTLGKKLLVDAKAMELREECGWKRSYGPFVSKEDADKRRDDAEAEAKRRAAVALEHQARREAAQARIRPAFDTVRDHSNPKFRSAR